MEPLNIPTQVPSHSHTMNTTMKWGDFIELSGTTDVKYWASQIACQMIDSIEHLEGLEDRPLTISWSVKQGQGSQDKTFTMPKHQTLDEADRSSHVAVGACTCPFHSGL